jgi:hypothetical protein
VYITLDKIRANIMINDNNIIIWQKWVDPFGRDDGTDDQFDNYSEINTDETDNEENEEETKTKQFIAEKTIRYGVKVIATPMGIIPVNDGTASGKIFNFWMGHTNFDITKKVAEIIEKTEGVESLDIYTRYRFRISIGKAFEDSFVMRDINKYVYKELANAYSS